MRSFYLKSGLVVSGLIAFATPGVTAQAQPAAQPLPMALVPNPAEFGIAALRIAQAVEGGAADQVWDTASPVLKRLVPRDQFAATARARLAGNGALQNLQWRSFARLTITQQQGQLQPGEYLSVNFAGINKDRKAVVETVSFFLDSDQTWRLVGLSVN